MVSKVLSAAPIGYEAELIEVESDSYKGLPSLQIVGMGNKAVDEARERVKSAIKNSLLDFPASKITINLAPAEIPKDGTYFDLPMAISILVVSNQLKPQQVANNAFVGELSLGGELRPVRGILNIIEKLKSCNVYNIFLPLANLEQASLIKGVNLIGVKTLKELFLHLKNEKLIDNDFSIVKNTTKTQDYEEFQLDNIVGQDQAKRALTIAIAGRHNILLTGPPGTGKTMLAKTALSLLPKLSDDEILEVSKIHGLANSSTAIYSQRPFRTPHHTASKTSIIGGGPKAMPGEVSLAHLGVLFLDELPEYPRSVLESLRQPLEDKQITITRVNRNSTYPANFMMIATMNPCPCGYLGDPKKECSCSPSQISQYQRKLSGPLLDRIDMVIPVNRIDNKHLLKSNSNDDHQHTKSLRQIELSLKIQRNRFKRSNYYNSMISRAQVGTKLNITTAANQLLDSASAKLDLSARAYFKILRVSRTIADIESSLDIETTHIAEALQYRLNQG